MLGLQACAATVGSAALFSLVLSVHVDLSLFSACFLPLQSCYWDFSREKGMKAPAPSPLLSRQESEKLWFKKKKKDSQQVPETHQLKQKLNLQILVTIFKEMWALRNLICSRAKYLCLKRSNKSHPKNQSVSWEQPWSCPANPTRCGLLRPLRPASLLYLQQGSAIGALQNPQLCVSWPLIPPRSLSCSSLWCGRLWCHSNSHWLFSQ